jgi:NAD(P)-dependent dehydrogenase (short-subunit alcohol dehydrogenase family)
MLPDRPRVVITGGSSGLGRALAVALAERNARILIGDVNEAGAEKTIALLGGIEAHFQRCDVTKLEDVVSLADRAEALFGGVDLAVNNAGVAVAGKVGDIPIEDWRWIVDVNLWGVIYGCQTFAPRMRARRSGTILNVASCAGLLCAPEMAPYNVTKAAVIALSETMASELKADGVTVSALCPMFFETGLLDTARGSDGERRELATKLMRENKLQAAGVAKLAIAGVERGEIHIVPHAEGRWLWRLKRLTPEKFTSLSAKAIALQQRRAK